MSSADHVTSIWIRGLRSLADVQLPLTGLTVLIGANGSGKSSIVEAFEILRKVSNPSGFMSSLIRVHDLHSLIRDGAAALELGVTIEGSGPKLEYSFAIERRGTVGFAIARETLNVFERGHAGPLHAILRTPSRCRYFEQNPSTKSAVRPEGLVPLDVAPNELALRALLNEQGARKQEAASRVSDVLGLGEVHLPFEVRARWLCEEHAWDSPLRAPAVVDRATRLERLGVNLVNAYATLKNRTDWPETLNDVQLGLGYDVLEILVEPATRGQNELRVRYAAGDVPAAGLSDGTLCYLAFVALVRFGADASFLVMDEPESHLDPGLLVRVLDMLEIVSETTPVVLATHSDRLLDGLADPVASVVLCDLDSERRTRLRRPDARLLTKWLSSYEGGLATDTELRDRAPLAYRGVGQLRADAPLTQIMGDPLPPRAREDEER